MAYICKFYISSYCFYQSYLSQGYFRLLFACIEKLLGSLQVKHFVLHAADEAESIWINKFGFSRISPEKVSSIRFELSVLEQHILSCGSHNMPIFFFFYFFLFLFAVEWIYKRCSLNSFPGYISTSQANTPVPDFHSRKLNQTFSLLVALKSFLFFWRFRLNGFCFDMHSERFSV